MAKKEEIESRGVKLIDSQVNMKQKLVNIVETTKLEISHFAAMQILAGISHWYEQGSLPETTIRLLLQIQDVIFKKGDDKTYSYAEIKLLIEWLEARISHCGQERADGCKRFNMETYLDMKLVLIDLREIIVPKIV